MVNSRTASSSIVIAKLGYGNIAMLLTYLFNKLLELRSSTNIEWTSVMKTRLIIVIITLLV